MAKFQKGESGNPGGRPKMPEELKAAMRGLADTAVKVLREAMEGDDPRARILAANTVLDRGYGKATQPIVSEGVDLGASHLEALQILAARRKAPTDTPTAPIAAPLADDGEKPPADRIN
jgi:nucleoid-associated protein YgaU